MDNSSLVQLARDARTRAHAPYSGFAVGAALLTSQGEVYVGVNVENASYGLTICAERSAVVSAVSAGSKSFTAIAIASATAVSPCGACRQVLAEFTPGLPILIAGPTGSWRDTSVDALLPDPFSGGGLR